MVDTELLKHGIYLVFILKIVCFILGYGIIYLGYKLIRDGIEGKFNFTSNFSGIRLGLVSSSPGLLFVLLGSLLMIYAIHVDKNVYAEINPDFETKINEPLPETNETPSNWDNY
tara:strand:+ start:727 stop:1068 length:342 start_codon:yes stop_codon:yes gene_type:complete